MPHQKERDDLTMRYLFGSLSEEEKTRFEERFFSDDAEFEELEIAEEELIDRYVRGELTPSEQQQFAQTINKSSRLTERVHFATLWKEKIKTSEPIPVVSAREIPSPAILDTSWWNRLFGASSGAPRLAFAASLLVIAVGGLVLFGLWRQIKNESNRLEAQQRLLEDRQRELDRRDAELRSLAAQLGQQPPPVIPNPSPSPQPENPNTPTERSVVAMSLFPGGTRSQGGASDLRIPAETKNVQLSLNLRESDYPSYKATLRSADGGTLFTSGSLRPRKSRSGAVLVFLVPSQRLTPGDYLVGLNGVTNDGKVESVDDYQFRVIK